MKWSQPGAELFVPDHSPIEIALTRTTHLGIGAHPDDLEFMAWKPILECRENPDNWFTGVTVTDGSGYPQDKEPASHSADQICGLRRAEQNQAATRGKYGAMIHLSFSSKAVKQPENSNLVGDLKEILCATSPKWIFTHNPADKHETHVALCIAVIDAIRELPAAKRPEALYGCEVWRGLDWMMDEDKVIFDVSGDENFMQSLMSVYSSQIRGKRYDEATLGRKRANATYFSAREADRCTTMEYAMNLTPLIQNDGLKIQEYVAGFIRRLQDDVLSRINRFAP